MRGVFGFAAEPAVFGPEARWEGKLRKLSHHAAALTERFVSAMNDEVRPDLVVQFERGPPPTFCSLVPNP